MKDFMTKLYCYDHKPVTENVESDSDSDDFHVEIKENVVEAGEDSEVVVAPKAKKRKLTMASIIDDSDEEKEKTQKKTTFENDSDDATPESMSKLNKTVSYDDRSSNIAKSIVDLTMSLKSSGSSVIVSGIVPRFDNLNNKASEVNNLLALMCKDRKVPFVSHSETIDSSKHLNESKLHLNHNGIKVFAENFSIFLKSFN